MAYCRLYLCGCSTFGTISTGLSNCELFDDESYRRWEDDYLPLLCLSLSSDQPLAMMRSRVSESERKYTKTMKG